MSVTVNLNQDTRLTPAVLEALGFAKYPDMPKYVMRRHGGYITVDEVSGGWMLNGMRPVDVGDLLMMAFFAGQKDGRRETVQEFLNHVEVGHVMEWVRHEGLLPASVAAPPDSTAAHKLQILRLRRAAVAKAAKPKVKPKFAAKKKSPPRPPRKKP